MHCVPDPYFTVRKALAWRSALHENPPYQRESAIWSLDKKQLFIDSILNGYDVPKLYLHDLRGKHPTLVYAVVDGKQRLTTLWDFVRDVFPLATDFHIHDTTRPGLPPLDTAPRGGMTYSQFDPKWRDLFRNTLLSVVLIQNATEEDIEDLFSRLNNGEPLNAAEKRNALGGSIAHAVRQVARHPFFSSRVRFSNARYHHYEAATRLLVIESEAPDPGDPVPDLRGQALDAFVRRHRGLPPAARRDLVARTEARLDVLAGIFEPRDALLARQGYPALYALFARDVVATDTASDPAALAAIRTFLADFQVRRLAELEKPEGEHDPELIEFGRLAQQGGHDRSGLEHRLAILERHFRAGAPAPARILETKARTPAGGEG
jgi:hypothetical protein